ncbi:uncharacterized protein LOC126855399 [Cataglyphis hispanica]|uniref:uncharacterized protein LOC126855399 n=1 Tax=Cataglyphis hispanica TaxID=1086592 RepID=UPI00217FB0B7|nr:uncharacterized protein LOC126855399 [Cataglyphis hispanica]
MTTLTLTQKQQRQSISAKKGPVKGLRNLLAQPTENHWPTVNIDQYPALVTLMDELLPLIKQPKYKIPGFMLRHTPKEKRVSVKKEALEKETTKFDRNILKSVILGINAVTRALEKDNVCCVLLDANVEPLLLIKHIVVMAQNKKIPVLLLPILKTITLQKIGFATAAFALKDDVMQSSDNVFHALYKLVAEIFNDFEPPKCALQLFKSDEISEESAMCIAQNASMDCDSTIPKPGKSVTIFTDVYKYRSSRKERAFIPPTVNKTPQICQTRSDEFIALGNDPDSADDENDIKISKNKRYVNICKEKESESETTKKDSKQLIDNSVNSLKHVKNSKKRKNDITYLPLRIKRVRGNDHREKATKFTKKKKK